MSLGGVLVTFAGAFGAIVVWYAGMFVWSWFAAPAEMDADLAARLTASEESGAALRNQAAHMAQRATAKRRVLELIAEHRQRHGILTDKDVLGPDGEQRWTDRVVLWESEMRKALSWHPPTAEDVLSPTPMSRIDEQKLSGGWRWMTPLFYRANTIAAKAGAAMEHDPWF